MTIVVDTSKTPSGRSYTRRRRTRRRRKTGLRMFKNIKGPLPEKLNTKLIYQETVTLNPGAGGLAAVATFSANGIYDVNIGGVGHQPRGFDELIAMYDHYVVHSAQIQVQMCAQDTTTPKVLGVNLRDSGTPATNPNDYKESSYTTYKVGPYGGNGCIRMKKNCNIKQFLGRGSVLSDPELKGSSGANPTEQAYFHVWVAPIDTSDAGAEYVDVRIVYNVTFIEPQQPSQS